MTNCPEAATPRSKSFHCRLDGDLQREYGPQLTCDVYWTQYYEQNGACAICRRLWEGVPGMRTGVRRMSTDHEHVVEHRDDHGVVVRADGPFRGLLCGDCNRDLTAGWERRIATWEGDGPIPLSGGDVISAAVVAYVRNQPAAGLRVWVTKKERPPAGPKQPAVSAYREELRLLLRSGSPVRAQLPLSRAPETVPVAVVVVDPPAPPGWLPVAVVALRACSVLCVLGLAAVIIVQLLPALVVLAVTGAAALVSAR